jgi:hypothetical protein
MSLIWGSPRRVRFPASLLKAVAEVDDATAASVLVDELEIGAVSVGSADCAHRGQLARRTGRASVMVVAARLAHARASTTLNVYAHAIPGSDLITSRERDIPEHRWSLSYGAGDGFPMCWWNAPSSAPLPSAPRTSR